VTTERPGALDGTKSNLALGLAINSATNTLYIADRLETKIVSRNLTTHTDTTLLSGVSDLYAIALDAANNKLYYTTGANVRVLDLITSATSLVWTGLTPYGLAVDSAAGVLYVSDSSRNKI
jgi:DNA-binding beta-propeller fold protein YncE